MKTIVLLLVLAAVCSSTNGFNVSPELRKALMQTIMQFMGRGGMKPGAKPGPGPAGGNAFMRPQPRPRPPSPPAPTPGAWGQRPAFNGPRPNDPNHIHLIEPPSPGFGAGFGATASGGRFFPQQRFCPPGPTTSDHCKDQKLFAFLYTKAGKPRYRFVPPPQPWDPYSISDRVKDLARDMLQYTVQQRSRRGGRPQPTPKEVEFMSLLGDPKDMPPGANPFGFMG